MFKPFFLAFLNTSGEAPWALITTVPDSISSKSSRRFFLPSTLLIPNSLSFFIMNDVA